MLKVILSGASGAMGRHLVNLINSTKDMEIVAGIDKTKNLSDDFPYFELVEDFKGEADCIIDFSHFTVVPSLLNYANTHHCPLVICTTGLNSETELLIEKVSQTTAIFKSGNMSLGINLLLSLVKQAATVLGDKFDVEVIEKHHNRKVDAPSGTAKMIANALSDAYESPKDFKYGRQGNESKRQSNDITIHAVRGGTIVGEHEVLFAGLDETIEIKHTALSRKVFAQGAVTAAQFIVNQPPGLYDMSRMLENY